jgi:hypothetical protein
MQYSGPEQGRFEADAGTTNRGNVRMELNAVFGGERTGAAVRIAASLMGVKKTAAKKARDPKTAAEPKPKTADKPAASLTRLKRARKGR